MNNDTFGYLDEGFLSHLLVQSIMLKSIGKSLQFPSTLSLWLVLSKNMNLKKIEFERCSGVGYKRTYAVDLYLKSRILIHFPYSTPLAYILKVSEKCPMGSYDQIWSNVTKVFVTELEVLIALVVCSSTKQTEMFSTKSLQ